MDRRTRTARIAGAEARARLLAATLAAALTLAAMAAAGGPVGAAEGEVRLLTWPTYTDPDLIAAFEAETGLDVVVATYESNEELATVLRGEGPPPDVVVPSDSWVAVLAGEGLLTPFDATTLEGFHRIEEQWLGAYYDPAMLYSIPFLWGTTSFVVNTAVYDGPRDSLALLFEPPEALRGRVGMMTDARDVIDLALRHLGLPACTDEPDHMERLGALLEHQRDFVADYTMEDIVARVARGDLAVQMLYNGAAMRARKANPAVTYVHPREGVTVWSDNLAIPAGAENPDGARLFLEFFLRPAVIAAQSNLTRYGNAVRGSAAFLDDDLREAPELTIPPDVPIRFVAVCPQPVVDAHVALWRAVSGIGR